MKINADDYGRNVESSLNIERLIKNEKIDAVSIFTNFNYPLLNLKKIIKRKNVRVSLHLNLIEGKPLSKSSLVKKYLCNKKGFFDKKSYQFFYLGLIQKNFKKAIYIEALEQIKFFKSNFRELCIDSHQHIHAFRVVFTSLLKISKLEKIKFIRCPNDYFYLELDKIFKLYYLLNIIKFVYLKIASYYIKISLKKKKIQYEDYCLGILNSGYVNLRSLKKRSKANFKKKKITLIVHPGYISKSNNKILKYYKKRERKDEFNLCNEYNLKKIFNK